MIEIKDLLGRFSHILESSEFHKEKIREIISKSIGHKIPSQDLKIKNGTIYLNIKPIYKNEILLKKDSIKLELKRNLGERSPGDLR